LIPRFDQSSLKGSRRAKRPAVQILVFFALVLGSLGAYLSTAPLVVTASGFTLIVIIALLWGPKAPPVLLLPPLYQWSEVSLTPISTIWLEVPLQSLSSRGADLEPAAFYGLLGVVMLSLGLRLAIDFRRAESLFGNLLPEAQAQNFRGISRAVFTLLAMGYFFQAVSPFAGPAREFFNSASGFKNAGLFILAYWCLSRGQNMGVLGAVFGFEILSGMTGFFADFKNSMLTLIMAALVARPKLGKGSIVPVAFASLLLVFVATFWSAVKTEYRTFVNQGTGAQVVLVPIADRVSFIADKASSFTLDDAQRGFNLLVARHGYIDFLGQTLRFVPYGHPHENGAITKAAINHITTPRLLFPEKPPLPSDTEVMARYTGQPMTWDGNTSISLGHLAELYIDFGYLGGLLAMLVIGLIVGTLCRKVASHHGSSDLLKVGLCLMVSLQLAYFGTAYVKLIGSIMFTAAIAIVFQTLILHHLSSLSALKKVGVRRRRRKILVPVGQP
jgi:hypothetical protein